MPSLDTTTIGGDCGIAAPDLSRVEATGLLEHEDWRQRLVGWNIGRTVGNVRVHVGQQGVLGFDSSHITVAGSPEHAEAVVPLYYVLRRQSSARTRVGELRIGVEDGVLRARTSDALLQQAIDDANATQADVA